MTRATLMGHILTLISNALADDYPTLRATSSMEDADLAYAQGKPWVLITLRSHKPNRWQGEDNWEFLLQGSCSLQPGAQADTLTANNADVALWDAISEAVNGDAGFAALRALGIQVVEDMEGLAEDQQSESYINPHVLSCSTY